MTANYKNSAGTDLDNLFYTNNGNAGPVGYLVANGQDLGNRYVSGSLGYNVGYKNAAGTDLGFIRGNLVAPTATATSTLTNNSHSYGQANPGEADVDWDWEATGVITPKITVTNGMSITSVTYTLQAWGTTVPKDMTWLDATTNSSTINSKPNVSELFDLTTSARDICSWTSSSTSSPISFIFYDSGNSGYSSGPAGYVPQTLSVRLKMVISNPMGSNTIYGTTHTFTFY